MKKLFILPLITTFLSTNAWADKCRKQMIGSDYYSITCYDANGNQTSFKSYDGDHDNGGTVDYAETYTYGDWYFDGKGTYNSDTPKLDNTPVTFYTVESANARINEIGDCDDPHQFGCSFKMWFK